MQQEKRASGKFEKIASFIPLVIGIVNLSYVGLTIYELNGGNSLFFNAFFNLFFAKDNFIGGFITIALFFFIIPATGVFIGIISGFIGLSLNKNHRRYAVAGLTINLLLLLFFLLLVCFLIYQNNR